MIDEVIEGIKLAKKDTVDDLSKLLGSYNEKYDVYQWVEADDRDLQQIKSEIEKWFKQCLTSLESEISVQREASLSIDIFNILRSFEKYLAKNKDRWYIYPSSRYSSSLIKDQKTNEIYYIDGWNSSYRISLSKVISKYSKKIVKGKKISKWILIANWFSSKAISDVKKYHNEYKNLILIDLGFHGEKHDSYSVYGEECTDDPLVKEIASFVKEYLNNLEKYMVKTGEDDNQLEYISLYDIPCIFTWDFKIRRCEHIEVMEVKNNPLFNKTLRYEKRYTLEALKDDLYITLEKLDELSKDEFVTIAVKKKFNGDLIKNDLLLLCNSCKKLYTDKIEASPDLINYIFEKFIERLGRHINCKTRYIKSYELGILIKDKNTIIVTKENKHPIENIAIFHPSLIIVITNFLSDITVEPIDHYFERFIVRRRKKHETYAEEDLKNIAYLYLSDYLKPILLYDWNLDIYETIHISEKTSSPTKIIESIVSIDYSISASEKAYKAPHDKIVDIYYKMGFELGFNSVKEYRYGDQRIDVVWLDKEKGKPEVCIEVEFSGSIGNDLWKICEEHPSLGVLVVKGNQYDNAVKMVIRSNIIKILNQKILILNITNHNYTLIEGNRIIARSPSFI